MFPMTESFEPEGSSEVLRIVTSTSLVISPSSRILCLRRTPSRLAQGRVDYGYFAAKDDACNGTIVCKFIVHGGSKIRTTLMSIICWRGRVDIQTGGGHFVAFIFDEPTKTWNFYDDTRSDAWKSTSAAAAVDHKYVRLETVAHMENTQYPPSITGYMFFYRID